MSLVIHEGTCTIEMLRAENEELRLQMRFWKQAAEHAVEGWLKQEDVSAELRVKLVEACTLGVSTPLMTRTYVRLYQLKAEAEKDDDAPDAT